MDVIIEEIEHIKLKETILKILITKEIINNLGLTNRLGEFLTESGGSFDSIKFNKFLTKTYNYISSGDVSSVRPNNIHELSENELKAILNLNEIPNIGMFDQNFLTQVEAEKIILKLDNNTSNKQKEIVKKGLTDYLPILYNKLPYDEITQEIITEIIEKILSVVENN